MRIGTIVGAIVLITITAFVTQAVSQEGKPMSPDEAEMMKK